MRMHPSIGENRRESASVQVPQVTNLEVYMQPNIEEERWLSFPHNYIQHKDEEVERISVMVGGKPLIKKKAKENIELKNHN